MIESPSARPPRAPGPPVLGSALAMAADPLGFLSEQHRRLGPIFRVRAAFAQEIPRNAMNEVIRSKLE